MEPTHTRSDAGAAPPSVWEDRYGAGSFERLLALLGQPCVSFAAIAHEFGVTREGVRQWHRRFLPDAPTGRERRRLCREQKQKHRLLADDLFRTFYGHVRAHLGNGRVAPIRSTEGFRLRTVKIDDHIVALRDATRPPAERDSRWRQARHAAYIYVRLPAGQFLFLPADALRAVAAARDDVGGDPGVERYRNTFDALPQPPR